MGSSRTQRRGRVEMQISVSTKSLNTLRKRPNLEETLLFASPRSQAHLLINRPRCSRQLWALIAGYFPIWNKCSFSIWWICTAYCHNLSDIMLYCFNATGNSWEWAIYRTHLASLALGSWLEKCNTSVITVTHSCNAVMALTSQRAVIGSSTYYFFLQTAKICSLYWKPTQGFCFVKLLFSMLNLFGSDPNAVSDEVLHPRTWNTLTVFSSSTLDLLKVSLPQFIDIITNKSSLNGNVWILLHPT